MFQMSCFVLVLTKGVLKQVCLYTAAQLSMQIKVQSFNDYYQNIEDDATDAPKVFGVTKHLHTRPPSINGNEVIFDCWLNK